MSSPKFNGGPAFPLPLDTAMMAGLGPSSGALGMTLRDYFAAQALPAILAQPDGGIQTWAPSAKGGGEMTAAQTWAANAYEIADAMLAARAA
jgi:hypothetical protein